MNGSLPPPHSPFKKSPSLRSQNVLYDVCILVGFLAYVAPLAVRPCVIIFGVRHPRELFNDLPAAGENFLRILFILLPAAGAKLFCKKYAHLIKSMQYNKIGTCEVASGRDFFGGGGGRGNLAPPPRSRGDFGGGDPRENLSYGWRKNTEMVKKRF